MTWNSRSFSGSPPAMKCAEMLLGGSSSDTVRLPATNDCASIWPPNVRTGFLLGCEPTKVSSAICLRSSIPSSSSKSAVDTQTPPDPIVGLQLSSDSPQRGARRLIVVRLDVFLPDPMHVDQIRGAYCAGRSARDDDHQIAALVAAQFQQRVVDLTNHAVGGLY